MLSISVNKTEKDAWYWKFENMGHYLVKSAYGLIQDRKECHLYKVSSVIAKIWYPIEELLPVMQPQEDDVRGQRPPGVCLDGRPPPVVNECPHWGCGVNSGAPYPGDKDASNIWGEPRLYLRSRTRETAVSGGLSLAREMPYP
ncbi:hypothetical protein AgCh_007365 [Apium graveolens]